MALEAGVQHYLTKTGGHAAACTRAQGAGHGPMHAQALGLHLNLHPPHDLNPGGMVLLPLTFRACFPWLGLRSRVAAAVGAAAAEPRRQALPGGGSRGAAERGAPLAAGGRRQRWGGPCVGCRRAAPLCSGPVTGQAPLPLP